MDFTKISIAELGHCYERKEMKEFIFGTRGSASEPIHPIVLLIFVCGLVLFLSDAQINRYSLIVWTLSLSVVLLKLCSRLIFRVPVTKFLICPIR